MELICGIDEAGRGTLCGSMFISGVLCDENAALALQNMGVRDSKLLSKIKRAKLAQLIKKCAKVILIEQSQAKIDEFGISFCLKDALLQIVKKAKDIEKDKNIRFLFDGNTTFGANAHENGIKIETIIKGDSKIIQIASASIIAKHAKDLEIELLHERIPQYGLLQHSGYGTKMHKKAIAQYGKSAFHRKSFNIKL